MRDEKPVGHDNMNPLQQAYIRLRKLEEHPNAAPATVLAETKDIAEIVRQAAIKEHSYKETISDLRGDLNMAGRANEKLRADLVGKRHEMRIVAAALMISLAAHIAQVIA